MKPPKPRKALVLGTFWDTITKVTPLVLRCHNRQYQKRCWMSSNVDGLQRDTRLALANMHRSQLSRARS